MANQKPVHEIRLGKVKAAIWRNETDAGPRYSVTIVRLYKNDQEDRWESSSSFGRDELPLVSKVADLVHTWIYQQSERREDSENSSQAPRSDSGGSSNGKRHTAGARS